MRYEITDHPAWPAVEPVNRAIDRRPRRSRPKKPDRRGGEVALVVALTLIITIGSLLMVPSAPALAHGRGTNGCTGVPDSGYGFDFHSICDRHDRCYRTRLHGSGYHGRRSCDRTFRAAMLRHCGRHPRYAVRRLTCRSVARVYYRGVRTLGLPAWIRHSSPLVG